MDFDAVIDRIIADLQQRVNDDHERLRSLSLDDFIKDIESRFFRTNSDTGANANAMLVWNMVRAYAGLPRLTRVDLQQKQADERGISLEQQQADEAELRKWLKGDHEW